MLRWNTTLAFLILFRGCFDLTTFPRSGSYSKPADCSVQLAEDQQAVILGLMTRQMP